MRQKHWAIMISGPECVRPVLSRHTFLPVSAGAIANANHACVVLAYPAALGGFCRLGAEVKNGA
jgi:hypothetical protein